MVYRKISNSQVFKENPELMRFLKVHTTALSLLRDYLGVTEVKGKEWKKKTVRKRNAVVSDTHPHLGYPVCFLGFLDLMYFSSCCSSKVWCQNQYRLVAGSFTASPASVNRIK